MDCWTATQVMSWLQVPWAKLASLLAHDEGGLTTRIVNMAEAEQLE